MSFNAEFKRMSTYQRLEFTEHEDAVVVRFVDSRIQDQTLVQEWGNELKQLLDEGGYSNVVINLRNVQFLASAALNKLVVLNKHLRKQDGQFVLAEVQGPIRDMFAVTNLDKVLPLAESEDEALAMCKKG